MAGEAKRLPSRKRLGFDFDGATFSHVGARVTFEVMLASFGLERPALKRIGAIVHYLDAGGVQPPEACGVESVLAGLRERSSMMRSAGQSRERGLRCFC